MNLDIIKSKLLDSSKTHFQKQWLKHLSLEEIDYIQRETENFTFMTLEEKAKWLVSDFPTFITKEFLQEENQNKEKNLKDIAKDLNIGGRNLSLLFKGFDLEIKKFYHLGKIPSKEDLEKDYCIDNLHPTTIMEKWNIGGELFERLFKKYKLEKRKRIAHNKISLDIFNRDDIIKKLNEEKLTSQEIADEYGVSHPTFRKALDELGILYEGQSIQNYRYQKETSFGSALQRSKSIATCIARYKLPYPSSESMTRSSSEELEIRDFCRERLKDPTITKNRKLVRGNKEVDIFIPQYSLAIEHNGIYRHCLGNPSMYPSYHKEKFDDCKSKNIQLLTIWDSEFHNKKDIVFSIILAKCGIFEKKIPGRKCDLREVNFGIAKTFYEENHLQGSSGPSQMKFNLALYFQNEIVGMMSFGEHHRQKKGLILSRCCFKKNTTIIGGSKKLFAFFIKKYNPEEIVTWSDNRYSNGTMYENLNFIKEKEMSEDYFYYNQNKKTIIPKQSAQKKNLIALGGVGSTESEMAASLRLFKVYDCGKIRWVWKRDKELQYK